MRPRGLVASASITVLLAGCGGDADSPGGGSTLPASTTATGPSTSAAAQGATTTAPVDPAKAAQAKAAILRAADLPGDFKEQLPEDDLDQDVTFQALTTCLGVSTRGLGSAASPTYVRGIATQVASTVEYIAMPSVQAMAMAFGGSEKLASCSKEAFTADLKRNAPEGATVGAVEVVPLDFPQLGQLTSASRTTTTLQLPGGPSIPITQDLVIVFKGEAVSRLTFLNPGAPFPSDLQRTLVEKVVSRT